MNLIKTEFWKESCEKIIVLLLPNYSRNHKMKRGKVRNYGQNRKSSKSTWLLLQENNFFFYVFLQENKSNVSKLIGVVPKI